MSLRPRRPFRAAGLALFLALAGPAAAAPAGAWRVPVEARTLPNGLTVVVS